MLRCLRCAGTFPTLVMCKEPGAELGYLRDRSGLAACHYEAGICAVAGFQLLPTCRIEIKGEDGGVMVQAL